MSKRKNARAEHITGLYAAIPHGVRCWRSLFVSWCGAYQSGAICKPFTDKQSYTCASRRYSGKAAPALPARCQ